MRHASSHRQLVRFLVENDHAEAPIREAPTASEDRSRTCGHSAPGFTIWHPVLAHTRWHPAGLSEHSNAPGSDTLSSLYVSPSGGNHPGTQQRRHRVRRAHPEHADITTTAKYLSLTDEDIRAKHAAARSSRSNPHSSPSTTSKG